MRLYSNSSQYKKLITYLKKYDVISFDIFDTTIIRICDGPEEIFRRLDRIAELKGIVSFAGVRRQAYKAVLEKRGVNTTLEDIYEEILLDSNIEKEILQFLMRQEICLESEVCVRNETVISIIKELKACGKIIVFSSDMYLPSKMIKKIFDCVGVDVEYDAMYVSCEVGKSKSKGDLYSYIANQFKGQKIVHMGDYFRADYYNAIRTGKINAVYYPLKGKNQSLYIRFLLNTVSPVNSYIYKWVYTEFAPALWCFCEWLASNAREHGCQNLLFLTREGAFLKELFDIFNSDREIVSHVLYASRRSLLAASSDLNWQWIRQTFGGATVDFLLDVFKINRTYISKEVRKLKVDKWEDIEEIKEQCGEHSKKQRELLIKMLVQMSCLSENIGIVDVGWKGSSQYFLGSILEHERINASLYGFYLGEFYDLRHIKLNKKGFLCSSVCTKWCDAVMNAGFIFENMLSPDIGTTIGYEQKEDRIEPILDKVNVLNDENIRIAQWAIKDFFINFKKLASEISLQSDKSIESMFQHLNRPSYKMARELGNIQWMDFSEVRYVAKPQKLCRYLIHPDKFLRDMHYCGWNSAFCLRTLKIPLPYFKIYTFFKSRAKK